ncbi:hypothetical protein E2C01_029797 [Portunus trituberculatus]|uniref:Uncharacterized protein n=1 Tax=Portunus trituberculatus TaxID=210409 RepID=A0A5B7EQA1_PORTR|nr:hypothetical protein [Portunus trituberculatus]
MCDFLSNKATVEKDEMICTLRLRGKLSSLVAVLKTLRCLDRFLLTLSWKPSYVTREAFVIQVLRRMTLAVVAPYLVYGSQKKNGQSSLF